VKGPCVGFGIREVVFMRTYEQLTGAAGRKVFYRAERYRRDQLFKNIVPAVDLGGERAALKNLSSKR